AGAVVTSGLSPSPLGLLVHRDPLKITCIAPRRYAGSTFELLATDAGGPARVVTAEPDQHKVDFTLDGLIPPSRCYRCRYRSFNGSAWQTSAFSTDIMVNDSGDAGCRPPTATPSGRPLPTSATLRQDRSWLLPVGVSAAGLALLLVAAVGAAAWRVKAGRQRAKRQEASCWTETPYPTTELTDDNYGAAVSGGGRGGPRAQPGLGSAPPPRDPWASPPATPHLSTFRSSE
ncbi:protein HIDE1, partial [Rhynochetos jubatus]